MKRLSMFASVLCVSALPCLAQKNTVAGMYVLQFPGQDLSPVTKYLRNQPAVRGGNLFVTWSQVDSGNGQYDWSSVESQIAPWAAINKHVNLIVWGVNQSTPNTGTPAYVMNDPGTQSVSCPTRGINAAFPVYYSPGYKNNYKTFIWVLLNRYGNDPRVGYIRFGLARGGEAFPTCLQQLMQLGGYSNSQFNDVWEGYIGEMTAFQQSVPHTAQLMAALNQYGWPIQFQVCDWQASNAVALGFGFGSQGLQLTDTAYPGGQCSSDWCAMFQTYQGRVPLELQTISASDPANSPDGAGSLTILLPFGVSLGAQVFEIYIQDWQVAYDPTSPNYAKYGADYRTVFRNTEAALGY